MRIGTKVLPLLLPLIALQCFLANAQDSTLAEHCTRWIQSVGAPELTAKMVNICDGESVDPGHAIVQGGSSVCPSASRTSGTSSERFCRFAFDSQAHARIAVSVVSDSPLDENFMQRISVDESNHSLITFFSGSTFAVEDSVLPAGLYRLIPSRVGKKWHLTFAKLDGEWNAPVTSDGWKTKTLRYEQPIPVMPFHMRRDYSLIGVRGSAQCPLRQGHLGRQFRLGFTFADRSLFTCIDPTPDRQH